MKSARTITRLLSFGALVFLSNTAFPQTIKPSYSWGPPYAATAWDTNAYPAYPDSTKPYEYAWDLSAIAYWDFVSPSLYNGTCDSVGSAPSTSNPGNALDPYKNDGVVYHVTSSEIADHYTCEADPKEWDIKATYLSNADPVNLGAEDDSKDEDTPDDDGKTDADCGCSGSDMVGDPIDLGTGNVFLKQEDGAWGKWLHINRFYNSQGMQASGFTGDLFGVDFTFSYSTRIYYNYATIGPRLAWYIRPDGKIFVFRDDRDGQLWKAVHGSDFKLTTVDDEDGYPQSWTITRSDNHSSEEFAADGSLTSITDRDGFVTKLTYSTEDTYPDVAPRAGLLLQVTDPQGRFLSFIYNADGHITEIKTPDDTRIDYTYDSEGRLLTVKYPGATTARTYEWNEEAYALNATLPAALTGIVDEKGNRFTTITYNDVGAATSTRHAGDADVTQITYNTDGSANVLMPEGVTRTYHFDVINGKAKFKDKDGGCFSCGTDYRSITYDDSGNAISRLLADGRDIESTYDNEHLETGRAVVLSGNIRRRTETDWNKQLRLPTEIRLYDQNNTLTNRTNFLYNTAGQLLTKCVIDTTDLGGAPYTCTTEGKPPSGVRRWNYTYCEEEDDTQCPLTGLLLSQQGPRTDVDDSITYSYYMDDSADAKHGDLRSVTNALGQSVTNLKYDNSGRVLRVRDVNGILTDLTYDDRGRVLTRSVRAQSDGTPSAADAVSSYDYDKVGNLIKVTDPDGVVVKYEYDDAHRLTRITDINGAYIQYALNGIGRTSHVYVYPNAQQSYVYSAGYGYSDQGKLSSVQRAGGALTQYFYDAKGRLNQITDPNGIATTAEYDELGRITKTIANQETVGGTPQAAVQFSYDSHDNLINVTDPDGLVTHYAYDGLDNRLSTTSPDTGLTVSTYDAAGNVLTRTDARGISSTRSYDALNRVTAVSYPDATQNLAYHYDEADSLTGCSGSYPVGRLTRVIENNVSTVFCYDAHGNVTRKAQTQGTQTDTTTYSYTAGDRLAAIGYPSGTQVSYVRDADGRIQSVSLSPAGGGASTAVSAVNYLPFGPVASYTLGNGQTITRSYDANYALTDVTSPALALHFARDAMGDITALGNTPGASPATETYVYDPLYRLKSVKDAAGTAIEAYTYNKTGDRLSKTGSGLATGTYGYQSGTHWLTSIGTDTRSYDADGHTTARTLGGESYGFGYNDRNRMDTAQRNGSTVGTYTYDAFGLRVGKTATLPTSISQRYVYNAASQLLGEYGSSNRDYIWLGNLPVAVVDDSGSSTVAYVHADGQGTPRAVTDSAGSTIWQWPYASNPFGEQQPTSSNGYTLNLRFPGQYYDAESGLAYNVNRDYEAATGRYVQSDPIGLRGGSSTYSYVLENPLISTDPLGLADLYTWISRNGDWGHAALRLEDGTYISWWPEPFNHEYPLGRAIPYFNADAIANDTFEHDNSEEGPANLHKIHLENLDEPAIKDWWDKFKGSHRWDSFSQNCSTTVIDALRAGGSSNHLIGYPEPLIWRPESALKYGLELEKAGNGLETFTPPTHMWH